MIKKCNIVQSTHANVVVNFDGQLIQLPYFDNDGKTVYAKLENNRYFIVTEAEYIDACRDDEDVNKNKELAESVSIKKLKRKTREKL